MSFHIFFCLFLFPALDLHECTDETGLLIPDKENTFTAVVFDDISSFILGADDVPANWLRAKKLCQGRVFLFCFRSDTLHVFLRMLF